MQPVRECERLGEVARFELVRDENDDEENRRADKQHRQRGRRGGRERSVLCVAASNECAPQRQTSTNRL